MQPFIAALLLFPERFTAEEIRSGILDFLIHAPDHLTAAAKLHTCRFKTPSTLVLFLDRPTTVNPKKPYIFGRANGSACHAGCFPADPPCSQRATLRSSSPLALGDATRSV
jgi:hypothetical protein